MTFPPQGAGLLAVMALTDDTMVEVTPPVATAKGPGIPALRAGETVRRLLKRLEVMEIVQANSREDISGATVKASAPVVVYGGAGGVTIPASAVGNRLGVQMFPLETGASATSAPRSSSAMRRTRTTTESLPASTTPTSRSRARWCFRRCVRCAKAKSTSFRRMRTSSSTRISRSWCFSTCPQ